MMKLTGTMAVLALALWPGVGVVARVDVAATPQAGAPASVTPRRVTPSPVTPSPMTPSPMTVPAAVQERLSWQSFVKDPARVQSLMRGVAKMKSRDTAAASSADYRKSWQYWAAMHSYYGPRSRQGGPIQQAINATPPQFRSFFNGLTGLVPPSSPAGLASAVWDGCQHGTAHFFTWHRFYLYYFERVLRDAAGDQTLRLPYWDYTDPRQVDFPSTFGTPMTGTGTGTDGQSDPSEKNPLYDTRRTSQDVQLDPIDTDIDNVLSLPDFGDFQSEVEGGIHGLVHCAMGNGCASPLMGMVPAAAVDPIFWLHHANIDRIWQCWLEDGGQVPGGAFRNKTFTFVNETGAKETVAVGKLFEAAGPIDYAYDHVKACGRTAVTPAPPSETAMTARQAQPPSAPTIAVKNDVSITDAVTTVGLSSGPVPETSRALLSRMMTPESHEGLELVLDGISAEAAPGVLFRVYLARKDAPERREYLGTINFFGLTEHASHEGGRRRFVITKAMRALGGAAGGAGGAPSLADFDVVFEATLGRSNTNAETARAQFNPKAGIKIKSMQLRVLPAR